MSQWPHKKGMTRQQFRLLVLAENMPPLQNHFPDTLALRLRTASVYDLGM